MYPIENAAWIWVDGDPSDAAPIPYTTFVKSYDAARFAVAEFRKSYPLEKKLCALSVEVSADVFYRLYVNGELIGCGPVSAGGDWGNTTQLPYLYFNTYKLALNADSLSFFAEVGTLPLTQCEGSSGKNGFILAATLLFEDGTKATVSTGSDWESRISNAFSPTRSICVLKILRLPPQFPQKEARHFAPRKSKISQKSRFPSASRPSP
jgi:hypothetical protein